MACWDFIKTAFIKYCNHCYTNYSLLNYLADLFKLFILLNYVYFAYMIFAALFHFINDYFERKPICQSQIMSRHVADDCDQSDHHKETRDRRRHRAPCTCVRSNVDESSEQPRKPGGCTPSVCNLFAKNRNTTASRADKQGEPLGPCSSSVERIQVEFNCKAKRPKKNRERIGKSRSCTKCGKNLAQSSRCASRGRVTRKPRPQSGNGSDSEDEFGLRR